MDCCCGSGGYKGLQLQERNPMFAVNDFVNCLESYYKHRADFTYSQSGTPFDANFIGELNIDCSTFVLLGLYGIPFEESPYEGYNLTANKYPWGYEWNKAGVRNAAQMCEEMTRAGMRLKLPTEERATYTLDEIRALGVDRGDIIFYAFKNSDGTWVRPDRFLHISHVAVVRGWQYERPIVETRPETETVGVPIRHTSWEYADEAIVAVCRPPLSAGKWSNAAATPFIQKKALKLVETVIVDNTAAPVDFLEFDMEKPILPGERFKLFFKDIKFNATSNYQIQFLLNKSHNLNFTFNLVPSAAYSNYRNILVDGEFLINTDGKPMLLLSAHYYISATVSNGFYNWAASNYQSFVVHNDSNDIWNGSTNKITTIGLHASTNAKYNGVARMEVYKYK